MRISCRCDHPIAAVIYLALLTARSARAVTSKDGEVVWAVNCGGDAYVDSTGVEYQRDPLHGVVGTDSNYGNRWTIQNVPPEDAILYQTERYHTKTFGYDVPVDTANNGQYVLVLKFCEVYFNQANQKVFDVHLNDRHKIISDLDIFSIVGHGTAHDEYVEFKIRNGKLIVGDEESEIKDHKIRVEFIKGNRDNPKINAMYVVRGGIDNVRRAAIVKRKTENLYEELDDDDDDDESEILPTDYRTMTTDNGPFEPDPYDIEDSSFILPVFIAIGAFIPILFCLCKL